MHAYRYKLTCQNRGSVFVQSVKLSCHAVSLEESLKSLFLCNCIIHCVESVQGKWRCCPSEICRANMRRFNLLLLAVSLNSTLLQAASSSSNELFVKPAHDDDCLHQLPCFTFTEYIQNASSYFVSNTKVFFRPGRHIVSEYTQLIVEDISGLSLIGANRRMLEGSMLSTIIECLQQGGFVFRNVKFLHISDIEVVRCGWKLPASLISTLPPTPHARAALLMVNVYSMVLETVSVGESSGYGLLGVNILGNSSVIGCSFYRNMWREGQGEAIYNGGQNESRPGGNALLVFNPKASDLLMEQDPELQQHVFQVTDCEFAHGVDASTWYKKGLHEYTLGGGSGLGFYLEGIEGHSFHWPLVILIHNSNIYSNAAPIGANALVIYSLFGGSAFRSGTDFIVHIKIDNCTFYNGTASQHGGGLAVRAVNFDDQGSQLLVEISNSGFFNNFGVSGGGMSYKVQGLGRTRFRMQYTFVLQLQNSQFLRNVGRSGGGLQIEAVSHTTFMTHNRKVYEISISSSTFSENGASKQGGSVDVQCGHAEGNHLKRYQYKGEDGWNNISFINCSLSRNRAEEGAGMHIFACTRRSNGYGSLSNSCYTTERTPVILWLLNLKFLRNSASQYLDKRTSILYIENVNRIVLSDSAFRENNSTAVCINGSQISFRGKLNFTGNKGYNGGGISLDCMPSMMVTLMYLKPDTHMYMTNNSALRYGGAISVRTECERANCFFQFHSLRRNTDLCSPQQNTTNNLQCYHSQIIMENNKAGIAGDSLYGGDLETCRFQDAFLSPRIFWTIFRIRAYGKQSPSDVASPPYKVCFCNGSIEISICTTKMEVHHIFKGQTFSVQAASTGQYNYASAAVVKTEVSESVELGTRQRVQQLRSDCDRLWYSIKSSDNLVKLKLSISNVHYTPAVIHVSFLQCPLGFDEWGDPPKCDCTAVLRDIAGLTCDIDTLTVHRPAGVWIGNYSGDIAVHTNCPLDYCKPQGSNVSLERLDGQCAFGHSGILCGACQPGLSLALGTSQCLQCSNTYLLLLIPFTVAGVALVFLLLKCNLTVSVGTINGLIFYANFIGVKQAIFFPTANTIFLTRFLSFFVAWVNLDLGIETCFSERMNANMKAWLQFVFPVYVWTLVGAMIIGSRYSTRIAKLTGSNVVPVLATLLLLSYAKLLRLVITVVSPITLSNRNGTPSLRWLQDGNVPFLQGTHIVLFTTALVTTVLYLVPFTLFVTLSPYLQAKSGLRVLHWVNKLKPLLDAYQGPYKDNFRYWTGMMLVVRIILFAVFASNTLGDPRVDLLAITVALFGIFVCFCTAGRPYKSRSMHIIESFYLLNLGIFTAATQFLKTSQASPEQQQRLACIMVGIAFAGFCVILGYHLYKLVRCRNRRILDYIFRQHQHKPQSQLADEQQHVEPPQPTVSVVDMSQLRERLLTGTDCTH